MQGVALKDFTRKKNLHGQDSNPIFQQIQPMKYKSGGENHLKTALQMVEWLALNQLEWLLAPGTQYTDPFPLILANLISPVAWELPQHILF